MERQWEIRHSYLDFRNGEYVGRSRYSFWVGKGKKRDFRVKPVLLASNAKGAQLKRWHHFFHVFFSFNLAELALLKS